MRRQHDWHVSRVHKRSLRCSRFVVIGRVRSKLKKKKTKKTVPRRGAKTITPSPPLHCVRASTKTNGGTSTREEVSPSNLGRSLVTGPSSRCHPPGITRGNNYRRRCWRKALPAGRGSAAATKIARALRMCVFTDFTDVKTYTSGRYMTRHPRADNGTHNISPFAQLDRER